MDLNGISAIVTGGASGLGAATAAALAERGARVFALDLAAALGVVGPTRMDYPSTIASVRAVARYVSRFLTEG